jgi:hypothetical protein
MGRRAIIADDQDERHCGSPRHLIHREQGAPLNSAGERQQPAHPENVIPCDDGNLVTLAGINLPPR